MLRSRFLAGLSPVSTCFIVPRVWIKHSFSKDTGAVDSSGQSRPPPSPYYEQRAPKAATASRTRAPAAVTQSDPQSPWTAPSPMLTSPLLETPSPLFNLSTPTPTPPLPPPSAPPTKTSDEPLGYSSEVRLSLVNAALRYGLAVSYYFQDLSKCLGEDFHGSTEVAGTDWMLALPDTMSLVPNSVAIVDMGDTIIVRRGQMLVDTEAGDSLLSEAVNLATALSTQRFPAAKLIVLKQPGLSAERLLMSRLSPSHTDSLDTFAVFNKALSAARLSREQVTEMAENCMPTDQPSFSKFLSDLVPDLAQYRNQLVSQGHQGHRGHLNAM
jgi:hypothetical protein